VEVAKLREDALETARTIQQQAAQEVADLSKQLGQKEEDLDKEINRNQALQRELAAATTAADEAAHNTKVVMGNLEESAQSDSETKQMQAGEIAQLKTEQGGLDQQCSQLRAQIHSNETKMAEDAVSLNNIRDENRSLKISLKNAINYSEGTDAQIGEVWQKAQGLERENTQLRAASDQHRRDLVEKTTRSQAQIDALTQSVQEKQGIIVQQKRNHNVVFEDLSRDADQILRKLRQMSAHIPTYQTHSKHSIDEDSSTDATKDRSEYAADVKRELGGKNAQEVYEEWRKYDSKIRNINAEEVVNSEIWRSFPSRSFQALPDEMQLTLTSRHMPTLQEFQKTKTDESGLFLKILQPAIIRFMWGAHRMNVGMVTEYLYGVMDKILEGFPENEISRWERQKSLWKDSKYAEKLVELYQSDGSKLGEQSIKKILRRGEIDWVNGVLDEWKHHFNPQRKDGAKKGIHKIGSREQFGAQIPQGDPQEQMTNAIRYIENEVENVDGKVRSLMYHHTSTKAYLEDETKRTKDELVAMKGSRDMLSAQIHKLIKNSGDKSALLDSVCTLSEKTHEQRQMLIGASESSTLAGTAHWIEKQRLAEQLGQCKVQLSKTKKELDARKNQSSLGAHVLLSDGTVATNKDFELTQIGMQKSLLDLLMSKCDSVPKSKVVRVVYFGNEKNFCSVVEWTEGAKNRVRSNHCIKFSQNDTDTVYSGSQCHFSALQSLLREMWQTESKPDSKSDLKLQFTEERVVNGVFTGEEVVGSSPSKSSPSRGADKFGKASKAMIIGKVPSLAEKKLFHESEMYDFVGDIQSARQHKGNEACVFIENFKTKRPVQCTACAMWKNIQKIPKIPHSDHGKLGMIKRELSTVLGRDVTDAHIKRFQMELSTRKDVHFGSGRKGLI